MTETSQSRVTARVVMVQDDLITLEAQKIEGKIAPLMKNEVIYIHPRRQEADGRHAALEGEILRVNGRLADAQVYETTAAVAIGDPVEQSGELLSVSLGPGLLGQVYDGLQNPLETLALGHGTFLPRGVHERALDPRKYWSFSPAVQVGDSIHAGDVIGTVQEGAITHRIMAPFGLVDAAQVIWVQAGSVTIDTAVVRLRDDRGHEQDLTLVQRWPVRKALPSHLMDVGRAYRRYPDEPMATTLRLIDTFFPIARGGTGCIPGPFGAGKTVLQHLLARYANVDVVIVVACGERAGEVVETITELPDLVDPRTGGSLMDRTVIICNTSSMPVAAREASIYTGITLGEYYRQMGYNVLLLADSTSRWAQAMRETSGRLEEIPGEEAFPAYLDSAIRGVYERAGVIQAADGRVGSLTLIGTVSPAGGNFEEPVTQSTLNTVKTFLGLSYDRAYKRFYPAVDPLISWSRYLDQLAPWYEKSFGVGWTERVKAMQDLLRRGDAVQQMMQVTGEEGITIDDFVIYQQALLIDMVYLQQDAFDPVDVSVPMDRQRMVFAKLDRLTHSEHRFADKKGVREFFTGLTRLFKEFNYTADTSPDYQRLIGEIDAAIARGELARAA